MTSCLVVDDSSTVRRMVGALLTRLGLAAREAQDGSLALTACREQMPDVILLDWHMPVMDGLAFLHELRALPGGAEPKVIFCTSVNQASAIIEALSAGADEYVMKPFDEAILRQKLQQVGIIDDAA